MPLPSEVVVVDVLTAEIGDAEELLDAVENIDELLAANALGDFDICPALERLLLELLERVAARCDPRPTPAPNAAA